MKKEEEYQRGSVGDWRELEEKEEAENVEKKVEE
jgi:hypothetical protein